MNSEIAKTRFAVVAVALALAHIVSASEIYVAPNGDNSTGTSWATAYTNLQAAFDVAQNGDTIYVKTNVYKIGSQLLLSKSLAIRGGYLGQTPEPGAYTNDSRATVIDGNLATRLMYIYGGITNGSCEGFTFRNGNGGAGGWGGGIYMDPVTFTFRNCIIRNNRISGFETGGGGLYISGGDIAFDRCILRDNYYLNDGNTHYGGALFQSGGRLVMRDCQVIANVAMYYGALCFADAGTGSSVISNTLIRSNLALNDWGVINSARTTLQIVQSTIADNPGQALWVNSGTTIVRNSILWNNVEDIYGSATVSYSCVENGAAGAGVITSDPLLTADYYLADNSPCLGAGTGTVGAAGLTGYYAQTGIAAVATGTVAMGYHHPGPPAASIPALYVDAVNGHNDNPGTAPGTGNAFRTLTKALSVAAEGTRISIATGVYNTAIGEVFPITVQFDDWIELAGENADTTILDAGGSSTRVMNVYDLGRASRISGLTMRGGGTVSAAGLYLYCTAVRIDGCTVRNNVLNVNEQAYAGVLSYCSAPHFTDVRITDNTYSAPGSTYYGGLTASGIIRLTRCVIARNSAFYYANVNLLGQRWGGRMEMRNCLVATNYIGNVSWSSGAGGIRVTGGSAHYVNMRLTNVTVVANTGFGLRRVAGDYATVTVGNSILYDNGTDISGSDIALSYTCYGVSGGHTDLGGNLNTNPLFADTIHYHEKSKMGNYTNGYFSGGAWGVSASNSPCIDTGDPNADWRGEPYPHGRRINMGVYGNTSVASMSAKPPGLIFAIQ